jgi:hypothetical protein
MLVVEVNSISSRSEFPAKKTFPAEEEVSTDFVELDSAYVGVEMQVMIDTFTKEINRSRTRKK